MGKPTEDTSTPYISPKELATRWRCSRSSVDRIARRAGFTILSLGRGKNGTVRFIRKEVLAYEAARLVALR
jgi:hypothetical protein